MERLLAMSGNKKTQGNRPTKTQILNPTTTAAPVSTKGTAAAAPAKMKASIAEKSAAEKIILDYPRESETIISALYTFRVGAAPDVSRVEISIDGEPWKPCRQAVGYWWYDWAGYGDGPHQARVRGWTSRGQTSASAPRGFRVETDGRKAFSVN